MENHLYRPARAARISDLFAECDPKTITKNKNKFIKKGQKKMVDIFRAFTDLFLLDIIENNVIFALYSTLGSTLEISLKQVDKDYIIQRPEMFENLDWITTNFKAYVLIINKTVNTETVEIPVYTSL